MCLDKPSTCPTSMLTINAGLQECGLDIATSRKLCEEGKVTEAIEGLELLLQRGHRIRTALLYPVLRTCISRKDLSLGRRVHNLTVRSGHESDKFLANHLICMYATHGRLVEAIRVFSRVPSPDAYMWSSIILAHARHGQPTRAIMLYHEMQQQSNVKVDNRIYVAVLKACASAGDLDAGKAVHSHIDGSATEPDIFVKTCLVDMYAKCGSLEDARRVFDQMSHKNVVTWNALIAGYVQQGVGQEALALYSSMQQEGISVPDAFTVTCLMQACASVGVTALQQGKRLQAQMDELGVQANSYVKNSLVNMYVKCGGIEDAREVFDILSQKDVVTWTAMITGYAQRGMCQEAINLFNDMQVGGLAPPNPVTFVCLLQACATAAALPLGQQLHAQIEEQGLRTDVAVGSSLVHMYARCGSMADAQQVFDSLPERKIAAWGALIAGYSQQGDSEAVMNLLDRMKMEGVQPDGIMFVSVLTLCSHLGLVDKGREYFNAMGTDYGVTPTLEHYVCMMDILGRAGHLDDALLLAQTMPFQPNSWVWHTLLACCRKWSNVEVGLQAFESAVSLDEKDAVAYILMANIYAGAEMWEEAKMLEARRVKHGAFKKPGQSWCAGMRGAVHTFEAL